MPEFPAIAAGMGMPKVSDWPWESIQPSPDEVDGSLLPAAWVFSALMVALMAPVRPVAKMGWLVPLLKP